MNINKLNRIVFFLKRLEKYLYFDGILNIFALLIGIKKISRIEKIRGEEIIINKLESIGLFCYYIKGILYVSKSKEDLYKGIDFHFINLNNDKMGNLLGFPKCCIDKFSRYKSNSGVSDKEVFNYYRNQVLNKEVSNNYLDFFEHKLIYHMPCSMNCKESIQIGKKMIIGYMLLNNGIKKKDIFYEKIYILFSNLEWVKISKNTYSFGSIFNKKGNLFIHKIQKGYIIKIISKNNIILIKGDEKISLDNYTLFRFS